MTGSVGDQGDLFRIVTDVGSVNTATGMRPGTGAIRLELTPLQLTRLAQELSAEAIQALGLALHFGEIRTDPIRVEIKGWSRNWLIAHGMVKNAAQRAAKELRDHGFTTAAYGPDGPFGPRLAVLNGGPFGWDDPVVEQVRDGRSRPTSSMPGPKVPVNPQVSALDRNPVKQSNQAVDNPPVVSDRIPVKQSNQAVDNAPTPSDRDPVKQSNQAVDNTSRPSDRDPVRRGKRADTHDDPGPAKVQVSALDWILGGRSDGPSTTRSVSEKKESLSSPSWSSGTLARTDLDQLLLSDALGQALQSRRSEAIAVLAVALSGNPARAKAALAYLDLPAEEEPERHLAGFLVALLSVPSGARAGTAGRLLQLLRSKGAHVPAMAPDDVVAGMVLTLVSSLATDPRSWSAWMVSGLKRDPWTSCAPLTATLEALTTMVTGVPAPVGSAPDGISVGVDVPAGSVDDPAYLDDLRQAVAGTPDEDEVMFEKVLRNPRRQALVLMRYQQRVRRQASAQESADAG